MNNTVMKTIDILKLISNHKEGLSLAQIAKELNLPKSTVFNIVHSLVELEMLHTIDEPSPIYKLGIESLKLGLSYINGISLDSSARRVLSQLCHEINETVFMSIPSGKTDLVYIMKYLSDSEYQTICSVGTVRSLLSVAMGKAILAAMPDEKILQTIPPELFSECSIPTITDYTSLLSFIHESRVLGYVSEYTAENPQIASPVAAPVLGMDGELIGAVSIVIMNDPMNPQRIHSLGKRIHAAALEISKSLGYLHDDLFQQFKEQGTQTDLGFPSLS